MTASTFGCAGLIRIVSCFVLMTITAGCTSTGVIKPDQSTIDADYSVIAFSVNTSTLLKNEVPVRVERLSIQYGDEIVSIRLRGGKTGLQRILFEVPEDAILISHFELEAGAGILPDHFLAEDNQLVQLTQGEITYLGRLEIEDVKFAKNDDGSLGKPNAVKLVFADELKDDQFAWEQEYDLFQNRVPVQKIVGNWAGQDYSTLWIKEWTSIYANSRRSSWPNSGIPQGARPNSSNNNPPAASGPPGQQPH